MTDENKWLKYGPFFEEEYGEGEDKRPRRLNLGVVIDIELARAIMNACRDYALKSGLDYIADYTLKLQEQFRPWIEAVIKEEPMQLQEPMPGNLGAPTEGCPCPQCQALRAQQIHRPKKGNGEGGHYL